MIAALLCLACASSAADVDAALERFRQAYRSPQPAARAAAVAELSKVPHERTLKVIVPLLTGEVPEVRAAAARGLGAFTAQKRVAAPMLMSALKPNQKEPAVRCAIYEGLGLLDDDLGFAEIVRGFRADRADVAKAAIAAAGKTRRKDAIDALIALTDDLQEWIRKKQSGGYRDDKNQLGDENQQTGRLEDIQKQVIASLQEISREKWLSAEEWKIWWSKRKATFEVPK